MLAWGKFTMTGFAAAIATSDELERVGIRPRHWPPGFTLECFKHSSFLPMRFVKRFL
jgi:hypothetical protein